MVTKKSLQPKVQKPLAKDTKPVSLDDVRQRMLALAGVGEPRQIEFIRLAVKKYEQMLSATKKISVGLHEVIDTEDNLTQLRAADAIIELTGMKPTKDTQAVVKVNVMVNLPSWAQPKASVAITQMYTDAQLIDKTGENQPAYHDVTTPLALPDPTSAS